MRIVFSAALSAALAVVSAQAPPPVEAGTALRLEVEGLVDRADLAIEARVLSARARLDARGRIETEYELAVARVFWGNPGARLVFSLPGGELPDGRGLWLPGMPSLAPGEDLVLFLTGEDSLGSRMPVGLSQGKLRVVRDRRGARSLASELNGAELVAPGAATPAADGLRLLDYAETLARIEAAAAGRRIREGR
jgi:hypothetical protein